MENNNLRVLPPAASLPKVPYELAAKHRNPYKQRAGGLFSCRQPKKVAAGGRLIFFRFLGVSRCVAGKKSRLAERETKNSRK